MSLRVLSLHIGHTWVKNPAHQHELRMLKSVSLSLDEALSMCVEEVISIKIDGVDVTHDVGDAPLFQAVYDFSEAAATLASENGSTVVTFGSPIAELFLERVGQTIFMSLVIRGPPAEMRLAELELDLESFLREVRELMSRFLSDLRLIAPNAANGPFAHLLRQRIGVLEKPSEAPHQVPLTAGQEGSLDGGASFGELITSFHLIEDPRPIVPTAGPSARGRLLSRGCVSIRTSAGTTVAHWDFFPFFAFRSLLTESSDAVSSWKAGEAESVLHFGSHPVWLDFEEQSIRISAKEWPLNPFHALLSLLGAAQELFRLVNADAPAGQASQHVSELLEEALELQRYCLTLLEGDVPCTQRVRESQMARPPGVTVSRQALTPWSLRKVSLRPEWTYDVGPLCPGGFTLFGRAILLVGQDGAHALDLSTGRPFWTRERVHGIISGPGRNDPALLITSDGLELVTAAGATAWCAEGIAPHKPRGEAYLRGAGRIVVLLNERSLLALRQADGSIAWRFQPPGASECRLGGCSLGALVAADTGFLYCIHPASGEVIWRTGTGLLPLQNPVVVGETIFLVGQAGHRHTLVSVSADSGEVMGTLALDSDIVGPPSHTSGRLVVPCDATGTSSLILACPKSSPCMRRVSWLQGLPSVALSRARTFLTDRFGRIAAVGPRGTTSWLTKVPGADDDTLSPPILATARGLIFRACESVHVLDTQTGRLVGQHSPKGLLGTAEMLVLDSLRVVVADPDGSVEASTIVGHLASIPT